MWHIVLKVTLCNQTQEVKVKLSLTKMGSVRISWWDFQKGNYTITVFLLTGTHLVLIGLLLVADGQVGGVDIQVDVVVTSNAPATLASSRHPLELHLDVMALLPLLARRGKAEDTTIHVHRPQQRCWHGCTSNLDRIRIKAQKSIYITLSLSVCFHPVFENIYYDQLF